MSGAVLDAGALIGFDRNDRRVVAIVVRALEHRDPLVVPAGVVAQAWRDGRSQVRMSRLLGSPVCEIVALDDLGARKVGQVCGMTGSSDITDVLVAITARERSLRVITSDPDDIRLIDARLDIVPV